jgi:hypothetical protein
LINTRVKIEAVALSVGYHSKKNFYRQFLRRFGVTPDAYRQRLMDGGRTPQRSRSSGTIGPGATLYSGTFDDTACIIEIHPRSNVKGNASYVATPMVLVEHGVQPFASLTEFVEISGETEADALERAAIFLEHRFGARAAPPRRHHDSRRALSVREPRR